jgi:hypothetical protein
VQVSIEYERDRKAWVASWLDVPTAAAPRGGRGVARGRAFGAPRLQRAGVGGGVALAATGALSPEIDPTADPSRLGLGTEYTLTAIPYPASPESGGAASAAELLYRLTGGKPPRTAGLT